MANNYFLQKKQRQQHYHCCSSSSSRRQHHRHRRRSASFDISSLLFYYNSPYTTTNNNEEVSGSDNSVLQQSQVFDIQEVQRRSTIIITRHQQHADDDFFVHKRSHCIHKLSSQLEFQTCQQQQERQQQRQLKESFLQQGKGITTTCCSKIVTECTTNTVSSSSDATVVVATTSTADACTKYYHDPIIVNDEIEKKKSCGCCCCCSSNITTHRDNNEGQNNVNVDEKVVVASSLSSSRIIPTMDGGILQSLDTTTTTTTTTTNEVVNKIRNHHEDEDDYYLICPIMTRGGGEEEVVVVEKKTNSCSSSDGGNITSTSRTIATLVTNSTTTTTTTTSKESTLTATSSQSSSSNNNNNNNNNNTPDILTEGQYFLSISMLVYMYSYLRETCRMGHTRVKMEEIDCNHHHHYTNHMTLLSNNQKTLTAGSIIRIVIDELEDYDNDTTITTTNNNNYDLHYREYEKLMMKELKQWIESSRVSQLDSSTQDLILNLRAAAARARWRQAMHVSLVLSGSSNSLRRRLLLFQQQQQQQWDEEEEKMNKDGDDATIDYGTIDPNKEQMIHYLRRQVARYRWKKVIAKVLLCVKLNGGKAPEFGIFNSSSDEVVQGNQYVNMNKLLRQALENDPKYFIEGSVMSNLIESSLEVVWFSDFTQNDVVYGICVQREEKKITVVFRGTVNSHNWLMNFRYDMMEVPNPVDDYYPGRVDGLSVHSGFALYLLRRRKDTRRSKMDEIFEKIETIGKELAPDGDYKLCITGHSLGGALATLFGFYCGAKLCLTPQKTKEVRIFTFASPRVGGESFLYAFQHLERAGWIRHARFSCTNDIVPLIPFCNFQVDNLKFYKHVGMRVQLHDTGRIGKWRLRKRLDVSYPLRHDWSSKIARGLMNCIFTNPNTPRGYKMYHTLTEYQRRMHLAMTYRKALGATVFFLDEKRQRLKSLDEYYGFQFKMNVDVYHICEHSFTPYTDGVDFRHRLTKVFLVTPLLYMWLRLLSMVTSADIVIPKLSHWIFVEQVPKILGSIPFLLIIQYLLKLTLGLNFNVEMIKIATKTFDIRWGRFRKMFGRLLLVVPLLNLWVKLILRLTNATVPNNVYWLMLQQLLNLWKLVPFLVKPIYMLLQLSFGLSFLMVALCKIVPIRARSNRWRRYESSFGKMLLATPMLVAWAFLFSAAYKNMALDKPTVGVMNPSNPGWGLNIHNMEIVEHLNKRNAFISNVDGTRSVTNTDITTTEAKLTVVHEQLQPIEEYATGIKFAPTLENGNGLYLVGAGVRKKSVIKVYAVAMYSTPKVLRNTNSHASLYDSARTFDTTLSMTSFVLEMVYSASAEKIAGAIAESVKPRYDGAAADIRVLESLIVEGVHAIGGQAIKGTTFRFDCSDNGVSVTVNGVEQGVAAFKGLGSAFVDVFMDGNSVSPTLIESCLKTWSSDENKSVAASLVELEDGEEVAIFTAEEDEAETDSDFAATKVDEPKETTAISSKLHYEHSDEDAVDESKLTTSPPERKHNLLKMVVKFAFPVF